MRSHIRSLFALIAAAALAVLATLGMSPTTASAATPYAPVTGGATASATTVARGGSVTVAGDNFCPDTSVTLTVINSGDTYITETLTADADGSVSTEVTLTRSGTNTINLTGQTSDCNGQTQVLGVKVSVGSVGSGATGNGNDAKNASGAGTLPKTGGVDFRPLWAGLGLLVAGGLLVVAAQAKRRVNV